MSSCEPPWLVGLIIEVTLLLPRPSLQTTPPDQVLQESKLPCFRQSGHVQINDRLAWDRLSGLISNTDTFSAQQ